MAIVMGVVVVYLKLLREDCANLCHCVYLLVDIPIRLFEFEIPGESMLSMYLYILIYCQDN